ncbi:hypothetical protein BU14_0769s0008 [Porphyra umbilicalis]|uniref:Uncharacterized protein n=1 Tax=Porphyra umbilicalis TaxID=2786 RepID=A0A1X6NP91_PORUM|nr:hypothetical protein BU14_0769s0008 [Porphyra umbilicalis]|eukprot:OSX70402.1 hypothetical protein BU14_0769s0008 [Porphyra umbilicalis]
MPCRGDPTTRPRGHLSQPPSLREQRPRFGVRCHAPGSNKNRGQPHSPLPSPPLNRAPTNCTPHLVLPSLRHRVRFARYVRLGRHHRLFAQEARRRLHRKWNPRIPRLGLHRQRRYRRPWALHRVAGSHPQPPPRAIAAGRCERHDTYACEGAVKIHSSNRLGRVNEAGVEVGEGDGPIDRGQGGAGGGGRGGSKGGTEVRLSSGGRGGRGGGRGGWGRPEDCSRSRGGQAGERGPAGDGRRDIGRGGGGEGRHGRYPLRRLKRGHRPWKQYKCRHDHGRGEGGEARGTAD